MLAFETSLKHDSSSIHGSAERLESNRRFAPSFPRVSSVNAENSIAAIRPNVATGLKICFRRMQSRSIFKQGCRNYFYLESTDNNRQRAYHQVIHIITCRNNKHVHGLIRTPLHRDRLITSSDRLLAVDQLFQFVYSPDCPRKSRGTSIVDNDLLERSLDVSARIPREFREVSLESREPIDGTEINRNEINRRRELSEDEERRGIFEIDLRLIIKTFAYINRVQIHVIWMPVCVSSFQYLLRSNNIYT